MLKFLNESKGAQIADALGIQDTVQMVAFVSENLKSWQSGILAPEGGRQCWQHPFQFPARTNCTESLTPTGHAASPRARLPFGLGTQRSTPHLCVPFFTDSGTGMPLSSGGDPPRGDCGVGSASVQSPWGHNSLSTFKKAVSNAPNLVLIGRGSSVPAQSGRPSRKGNRKTLKVLRPIYFITDCICDF